MDEVDAILAVGGVPQPFARSPALRHLLRAGPSAIGAAIRHLGDLSDETALAARAADPNTDPAALRLLAGICPAAFSSNPVLPLLLLEDPGFPASFDPSSLGRLLSYPGVPADLVAAIARFGHPDQAQAARLHVALTPAAASWRDELADAVAALPVVPEDDLLALLVALDAVPGWLLPRIARVNSPRIVAARAAASGDWSALASLDAPATPAVLDVSVEELALMLEDERPAVRAVAAADPRLSAPQLAQAKLAEDWTEAEPLVYRAIAGNPRSSSELLLVFAADRSALLAGVRRAVARNPNAPPAALALLADEPFAADLRLIVAAHPNLAAGQRAQILAHSLRHALESYDPVYAAIALSSADLAAEQIAPFVGSPFWLERLAVAMNPAADPIAREQLAADGNRLVRAAAREPRSST
jgi:hypothetical protein